MENVELKIITPNDAFTEIIMRQFYGSVPKYLYFIRIFMKVTLTVYGST